MQDFWDQEKIFFDGDLFFEDVLTEIDRAQELITIEMYLFRYDQLGSKIAERLIQAHRRGVKVQILVDGIGSYDFFLKLHGIFSEEGIKVKLYNPIPFFHPLLGILGVKRRLQVLKTRIWRLNSRNHRKIITIDSRIMFTGSFNITSLHTRFSETGQWKDIGAKVIGENVQYALLHFKKIWKLRDYYRFKKQVRHLLKTKWNGIPIRLNHNLFLKRFLYLELIKRGRPPEEKLC